MTLRLIPKKAKPATLPNVLKFLDTLSGRDKTLRFVQYFSRFLTYQLFQADPKSELGARLQLLYKGLSTHRKVFKLGKFVDEYEKFKKVLAEAKEDLKKTLTLALRFFMGVFLVLDNLVWATSLKIIKLEKDPLKKRAYYFRLTAAFLNASIVAITMTETQEKIKKAKGDELVKVEEKQSANLVAMVKNLCDIVTYSNSAKVVEALIGRSYDDGTIGLLGSVSAVAGGYAAWLKM